MTKTPDESQSDSDVMVVSSVFRPVITVLTVQGQTGLRKKKNKTEQFNQRFDLHIESSVNKMYQLLYLVQETLIPAEHTTLTRLEKNVMHFGQFPRKLVQNSTSILQFLQNIVFLSPFIQSANVHLITSWFLTNS